METTCMYNKQSKTNYCLIKTLLSLSNSNQVNLLKKRDRDKSTDVVVNVCVSNTNFMANEGSSNH